MTERITSWPRVESVVLGRGVDDERDGRPSVLVLLVKLDVGRAGQLGRRQDLGLEAAAHP